MEPTIVVIATEQHYTRYRIEGGDLTPDWAAYLRPARIAWCDFTIWHGSEYLGSYGGEVWPSAWPALFEPTKLAGFRLTTAGKVAIARAEGL